MCNHDLKLLDRKLTTTIMSTAREGSISCEYYRILQLLVTDWPRTVFFSNRKYSDYLKFYGVSLMLCSWRSA